jgi:flagellar hook-associated protein 2
MTGLQLSGLASGMDTDAIITQLMSIEQQPRDRMARQQVTVQARQDALRSVDTKLTALRLAASDLRSASLWSPTQTVASGDESVLTARRLAGAAPGGYAVTVSTMASADSRTYAWSDGGGALTVDYKANGVDASKAFDLTGQTLDQAVATINGDAASPVWAVNVNGKLSLSRRETGDHAAWGFEASGAAVGPVAASREGTDATYAVAGDATTYTSHTNVATAGLPGLELTLKSVGTSTVTVSAPAADPEATKDKLKAFVSAYNDAVTLIRGELSEQRVVNPQSDDDAKKGVLFGDPALGALLGNLRQMVSEAGLDQLGVEVASSGAANSPDALAGKLTFDEAAFDTAWAADPNGVKAKLGSPEAPGFAQSFEAAINPFTEAGDGLLDQRVADATGELSYIKDQLARMDDRLQAKEDLLRSQFTAMETALSQSQAQSSDLAGQLAQLAGS